VSSPTARLASLARRAPPTSIVPLLHDYHPRRPGLLPGLIRWRCHPLRQRPVLWLHGQLPSHGPSCLVGPYPER
jgi:hypothetical protein